MNIRRTLAILLALFILAGCGQKGPLYRPGKDGGADHSLHTGY